MGKNKKTPTEKQPEIIHLTDEDRFAISSAEKEVVALKCKLANYYILQQQVAQQTALAEREMIERINKIARSKGIDPEDPSRGRWNFDTKQMIFTRLD